MEKRDPQKRKPLHATALLDEITDNVRNRVMLAQSKLEKAKRDDETDDSDDSFKFTSDSDSEEENKCLDARKTIKHIKKNQKNQEKLINNIKNISIKKNLQSNQNLKISLSAKYKRISSKNNENNYMLYIIAIFILVCFSLIYLYRIQTFSVFATSNINYNKKVISEGDRSQFILNDVKITLKNMMLKYQNQEKELWQNVFVSISNIILDPKKPSIIVLLGEKTDPLDCLAVLLGNVSSNALNSESLLLTPEKFDPDTGSVIESLRVNIKDKKAVIVWDLLNINVEALKAFHNLCDRINPLVEEVIYIITIIADSYDKKSDPLEFVEKELFKKLSGKIKEDAIQPLITRITDGPILAVKPEPKLQDCPLPKATKKS